MNFSKNINLFKNETQISKTHNRFQLQCPYNINVLRIIRKIKKKYYCKKTKIWYLPLEGNESFKDQLSDYPEFEFKEKESKPVVFIKTIADCIEIKFRKFIDEFKKY